MKLVGFFMFLLLVVFTAYGFMATSDTYLINDTSEHFTAKVQTWAQATMAVIFAIFCYVTYTARKRSKKLLLAWAASCALSVMSTVALVNSEKYKRIEYYIFGVEAASLSYDPSVNDDVKVTETTLFGKTVLASSRDTIEIFTGICPICIKPQEAISPTESSDSLKPPKATASTQ